ncbi:chemotaxis-related protein WspB [Pseudomonas flavescens]|uniref:Chemotaxis-related protein WspB n=1 Tax=Phytopseudomonas flavescens TaxID=29435 RepID=A0A1G8EVJ9_9GAMM|nr:chemotaxis protein CheW [Pseudomonas flavescens]SDH73827.1 chemotaxis-related protein WspB [Pseudomonas flavescens]
MSESARPLPGRRSAGQLFLLFSMGSDRYALDVREVVEVMLLRRLKQIPAAPGWVAGLFAYRGKPVPVLDLACQALGRPAIVRTSTRLVVVSYQPQASQPPRLLGLILEQASDTLRSPPEAFVDPGMSVPDARYLGPVLKAEQGLVQWVRVADLLDEPLRQLLFAATLEGSA